MSQLDSRELEYADRIYAYGDPGDWIRDGKAFNCQENEDLMEELKMPELTTGPSDIEPHYQ